MIGYLKHCHLTGSIDMRDGSTLSISAIADPHTGPMLNISVGRPAANAEMSFDPSHAKEIVGRINSATHEASRAHMGKCMDAWMAFVRVMLSEVEPVREPLSREEFRRQVQAVAAAEDDAALTKRLWSELGCMFRDGQFYRGTASDAEFKSYVVAITNLYVDKSLEFLSEETVRDERDRRLRRGFA